jgi:hypothetical protein
MVKLNAEGVAVWPEYEKKKIAMLSQTREIMLKEAQTRKEAIDE